MIPKRLMGEKVPPGELIPGTLDMLILKALSRGERHGYGVAQFIQRASDDVLKADFLPFAGPSVPWRRIPCCSRATRCGTGLAAAASVG